jgi:hypothetical protein
MRRVIAPAVPLTGDGGHNMKALPQDAFTGHLELSRGGHLHSGRPTSTALPIAANYRQGSSSGRSQKDGVSTPAVIMAQSLKKGKSQNDLPQLPEPMEEIRERS